MKELLEWTVKQDIRSCFEGDVIIFYLRGSSKRFSSEELVCIFENKMDSKLEDKWRTAKKKNEIYKSYN